MERIEFIEATTRLEQYYEKTYTKEQLRIMYEELKNIAVDRYKKAIVQIIRNQKYLPKISDILEVSNEIPKEVKEIEKTNCEKCKGTGYVLYKKKVNDSLYEYGALCDCGNAPEYNGKDYYIKYGNFIVQHPDTENTTDNTSFTALDYMIKFNQPYVDLVEYPCTLRQLTENICSQLGIELSEESFRNENFEVENNQFVNGESYRQVLQGIAMSAFSWARIDENNVLHLDFKQREEISATIDYEEYYNLNKDDLEYGPINRITIRRTQIEETTPPMIEDAESIQENGLTELVIYDNPFAYTDEKGNQLISAASDLLGLKYMPINSINLIGFCYLNCTDKIRLKTMQDEYFDTYLFNHIINYNGVVLDEIQTPASTKTEVQYTFVPETRQAIKFTQLMVDKANQLIQATIEKQDEQGSQIVDIQANLEGVSTTIRNSSAETQEQINELRQSIEGTQQTLSSKGGNNLFYYAKEFWNDGTENGRANLEEYSDNDIEKTSVSGIGHIINSGVSRQAINVKNDTYTVSFLYKKIKPLANGYVEINGTRYDLTDTNWKEEIITLNIDTNLLDFQVVSDTDEAFEIIDLMGTSGAEKQVWTQNPNETRTDTVTIGKGIQVNSSTKNTYARFDADGNRIINKSTNEIVTELTDKGVRSDYFGPNLDNNGNRKKNIAELGGILIQEIDGQTWFSSLL